MSFFCVPFVRVCDVRALYGIYPSGELWREVFCPYIDEF